MGVNLNVCTPCGYGIITSSPPVGCNSLCVYAPDIMWLCSDGIAPGQTDTLDLMVEGAITLPDGNFVFSTKTFDSSGINIANMADDGKLTVQMKSVYTKDKKYNVEYRITEVDGARSASGTITFCMPNLCVECRGTCNPLNADCAYGGDLDLEVACNTAYVIDISSWSFDSYIYTPVAGSCVDTFVIDALLGTLTINTKDCTISHTDSILLVKGTVSHEVELMIKPVSMCNAVPSDYTCDVCTGEYIKVTGGSFEHDATIQTTLVTSLGGVTTYAIVSSEAGVVSTPVIDAGGLFTFTVDPLAVLPRTTTVVVSATNSNGLVSQDNLVINIDLCKNCDLTSNTCDPQTGICTPAESNLVIGAAAVSFNGDTGLKLG